MTARTDHPTVTGKIVSDLGQRRADAFACPVLPSRASLEAGSRGCRCTP